MPVWEFRLGLSRGVGLMWTGRRRLVVSEVGLYREDRGLVGEAVKLEDGACLSCCILLLRFGRIISIIQLCECPPLPLLSSPSIFRILFNTTTKSHFESTACQPYKTDTTLCRKSNLYSCLNQSRPFLFQKFHDSIGSLLNL